jgi:hypothetical protein
MRKDQEDQSPAQPNLDASQRNAHATGDTFAVQWIGKSHADLRHAAAFQWSVSSSYRVIGPALQAFQN